MRALLLIDLAICAAVIMVAAAVMVVRRRRGSDQPPMSVTERRGAVAGLADEGMSGREVAAVPGLRDDDMEPGAGTNVPADPVPADPVPADPGQAAESPVSGAAEEDPGSRGLSTNPAEPRAAAGTVTVSERVGGYYEEADAPVAGYLAARGWTGQQQKPGRVADADAAPASRDAAVVIAGRPDSPGPESRALEADGAS